MTSKPLQHLKILLALASRRSDALLTHTHRLLSTSQGLTSTLTTLYYTLMLVHSQLTRLLTNRYEKLALSIASKASGALLPGETMVAHIEAPHLRLTDWCAATKSLGDATEDVRLFLRLWGLVGVYNWARETNNKVHRDPAIKLLIWLRIGAYAGFQAAENGAYLVRKGVLRGQKWAERAHKLWVWSGRFWVAEVVLEMLRLARVRQMQYNEDFGAEKVDEDEKIVKVQSKALEKRWWRDLYAYSGWFLPGLHFSFNDEEHSPVSEALMGLSGMVPGMIGLQDAWRATA